MSTGSDSSVIKKKALSGRQDFDARAMSWSKAVRLSLERVSDRLFGLQLAVRTVEQTDVTHAELREVAAGDRLIMLLDAYSNSASKSPGDHAPCCGAALLDRGLVQSLVEVQTRGYVTKADLDTRAFTHTDAAVSAQLIDPVLASVDEMMLDTPQSPDPLRLRFGDRVEDVRALLLTLDAPDFVLFKVGFDVEDGLRNGEIAIIIPTDLLRAPSPDPEEAEQGEFDLSSMALSAPIALNAIVARLEMPLSRLSDLKPGMTLSIDRNALTETELLGSKGFLLGKVALGQMNGLRAVRLGSSVEEEMVREPLDKEVVGSPSAKTRTDPPTELVDVTPPTDPVPEPSKTSLDMPVQEEERDLKADLADAYIDDVKLDDLMDLSELEALSTPSVQEDIVKSNE